MVPLIKNLQKQRYDWDSLSSSSAFLSSQFASLKLVLNVLFSHPPGPEAHSATTSSSSSSGGGGGGGGDSMGGAPHVQPLRLLFTDQTKVVTSAGGENSVTQMIG